MKSDFKTSEESKIRHFLYRLRRYPHNQITETDRTMAGDMLNSGNRKVTYFVLIVLLFSSIPMVPSATADQGEPEEFQAQYINATFDPVSEETTITWRNIAD